MKPLTLFALAAAVAVGAWLMPRPDVRAQLECLESAPVAVCLEAGR